MSTVNTPRCSSTCASVSASVAALARSSDGACSRARQRAPRTHRAPTPLALALAGCPATCIRRGASWRRRHPRDGRWVAARSPRSCGAQQGAARPPTPPERGVTCDVCSPRTEGARRRHARLHAPHVCLERERRPAVRGHLRRLREEGVLASSLTRRRAARTMRAAASRAMPSCATASAAAAAGSRSRATATRAPHATLTCAGRASPTTRCTPCSRAPPPHSRQTTRCGTCTQRKSAYTAAARSRETGLLRRLRMHTAIAAAVEASDRVSKDAATARLARYGRRRVYRGMLERTRFHEAACTVRVLVPVAAAAPAVAAAAPPSQPAPHATPRGHSPVCSQKLSGVCARNSAAASASAVLAAHARRRGSHACPCDSGGDRTAAAARAACAASASNGVAAHAATPTPPTRGAGAHSRRSARAPSQPSRLA